MERNDISVDISSFGSVTGKLKRICEDLIGLSSAMTGNLKIINRQFNSVNFTRASDIIDDMKKELKQAVYYMDNVKVYFDRLEYCLQNYLKCVCEE